MKRVKASDFPELRRFFAAYLHEDYVAEHGTPAAGLRAFVADASSNERQQLREETKRFLEATRDLEFARVVDLLEEFGSRWTPESREELVKVLERVENKS